jgi:hypothetical protein
MSVRIIMVEGTLTIHLFNGKGCLLPKKILNKKIYRNPRQPFWKNSGIVVESFIN